jgi:serine/threonine protein kinase
MISQIITDNGLSYEVLSILNRGSQGTIYKVKRKERFYACKLFHDISSSAWENLKQLVLQGPPTLGSETSYIWPLHVVKSPSKGYIMEFVNLEEYRSIGQLTNIQSFTIVDRVMVAIEMMKSLLALHLKTGKIFGDISPNNIIIHPQTRTVKIMDTDSIGIHKFDVIGTSGYMSKTTLIDKKLNFDSDVFATYVMVNELILARHPYDLTISSNDLTYEELLNQNIIRGNHLINYLSELDKPSLRDEKTTAIISYFISNELKEILIEMLENESLPIESCIATLEESLSMILVCSCGGQSFTDYCPKCLSKMEN